MIKEIKYNGFTETPSDYECPDGDLATVTGLVPEDEALHPVQPPVTLFTLPQDFTVVFVHANASGYKHYIIRHDYTESGHDYTDFFWIDKESANGAYSNDDFAHAKQDPSISQNYRLQHVNYIKTFTDRTIYEVNAIGNTLLFLTDDGMYYFLWKGDTDGYKDLGNHIPETQISFGLQGQAAQDMEEFDIRISQDVINAEIAAPHSGNKYVTDAYIDALTEQVLAQVNKFINEQSLTNGNFIFPFFVRYAYRLYDESLIMHSVPVIMITDTYLSPHCFVFEEGASGLPVKARLGCMLYKLDYKANVPASLGSDWGDIVKSVDIFISEPIRTYNQAGKIKSWSTEMYDKRGYGVFNIPDDSYVYDVTDIDNEHYCRWWTSKLMCYGYLDDPDYWFGRRELDLPRFTDEEIKDKMQSCHNFYLLKSIRIDELSTESRAVISVPENFLISLVNREVMTDDTDSHDLLIPHHSFTYNSRLNISNIDKRLLNPFVPTSVVCKNDYSYETYTEPYTQPTATYLFYVFIKQDNKEMVIPCQGNAETMGWLYPFFYFYYPNPNAYKVVIAKTASGTTTYYELPLKKHDFLNGAVYFEGWSPSLAETTAPSVTTDNTISLPNKLYTSEVDNPFVFPATGRRTIGISQIVGIRPAVKAMSPSQYGQFKFYIFTNDGVWALEVSSEGYLQEPTLVAPDVVLGDARSITQIDGAVLFASERGIMMLSGSTCTCISDLLNSRDPFVPFATNEANDVLPGLRNVLPESLPLATNNIVPFRTFIQDCSMLYDYAHQRIILYSPTHSYAYAFSLKSKLWGMMPSAIKSTLLDYPNATAMIEVVNNSAILPALADYSQDLTATTTAVEASTPALIITRPLKLDMPNVLKTVDSVIQRGDFHKGNVKSILYGSRDLEHWFLIKSSVDQYLRGFRGTPFKYFRIALVCDLDKDESIFGCSISYAPRYMNQLR